MAKSGAEKTRPALNGTFTRKAGTFSGKTPEGAPTETVLDYGRGLMRGMTRGSFRFGGAK